MRQLPAAFLTALLSLSIAVAGRPPARMEPEKPVEIDPGFFSSKYRQEGRTLDVYSLLKEVEKTPEAQSDATMAKVWLYTGTVTGGVGGFLVGYFGVQPLFGKDLNVPGFSIGVGLIVITLGFSKLADHNLSEAVKKYNAYLKAEGLGLDWNVSPERSGVALQFKF